MKLTTTRYLPGGIHAYNVSRSVCGSLDPETIYRVDSSDKHLNHAVAPNLNQLVYATSHSVVCISRNSETLWQYDLEPRSTQRHLRDCSCVFSQDGTWVWVYRPDAMADRGPDILVVLRADTGQEVARTILGSVGEGAQLVLHPDGRHVLLDVGEGQDGVKMYRAAFTGESIDLHSYGWEDRVLIDVAPDGQSFMTVDHGRYDVAFHAFLSGEVVMRIPIEAFGHEYFGEDEAGMDWNGGFLNPDIAVATIAGEKDDKEWHRHYSIDLRTGDGTWIVSGPGGNAIRYGGSTDQDH